MSLEIWNVACDLGLFLLQAKTCWHHRINIDEKENIRPVKLG
jgi:hypothetical protein